LQSVAAAGLILGVAASIKIALANILLVGAFVVWVVALVRGQAAWRWCALYPPAALYAAASIAAVLLSSDRSRSLPELPGVATLLVIPMTVSLLDGRRWDRLLLALAAVAAVSSSVALWRYLGGASDLGHRLHGLANHYMTFSGWTLLVALLLVGDIAFDRDRRRLTWTVPVLLLCLTALALSLTRGAWVGLLVGVVLIAAIRKPVLLLLYPVVVLVLVLALPRSLTGRAVSILDLGHPSNYDRLCMAEAGFEMVRDNPVFGVGLGMVKPTYGQYRVVDAPRSRVPHLHNNVLQVAAERGLFGLVSYIAILVVFFRHAVGALRSTEETAKPPLAGCLVAITGLSVAGLFEYNWGDAELWIPTLVALSAPFALASGGAR
jgi:O-antigen ligase